MEKPAKVKILGKEYTVTYCDNPGEVDPYRRRSLWGHVDYWTRSIRIYDNHFSESDIIQSLLHEVLHVIGNELNLEILDKGGSEDEEKHDELDEISLGLMQVLVDNKWLVW